MRSDPISDLLSLVDARSALTGGVRAGMAWALRFPPPQDMKFIAICGAGGWFRPDGENDLSLSSGDVLLIAKGRGFLIGSDLTIEARDVADIFDDAIDFIAAIDGGETLQFIGGHVEVDPATGWVLSSALPSLIHVTAASPEAPALNWLIRRLVEEGFSDQIGGGAAVAQISQLLFVHILRAHLAGAETLPVGPLRASADKQLLRALRLIHAEPARNWRLAELANAAGMSRTTFAERFKRTTGSAPVTYITRWRMLLAARALGSGAKPVGQIAQELGYTSGSAFSQAFKRVMGTSPRHASVRTTAGFMPAP